LDAGITEDNLTFDVYPNPATDVLNIVSSSSMDQLNILDLSGKIVRSEQMVGQGTAFIEVVNLEAGTYLLQLLTEAGISTKTFIKE
jgi:hypothetical protein